jgi:DNA-binding transcriptional LysR family regulator
VSIAIGRNCSRWIHTDFFFYRELKGCACLKVLNSFAIGFVEILISFILFVRIRNISQSAAEIATLISLVDAQMGITILPASAVKYCVASVVACDIVGDLPLSEIARVCDKRVRTSVVDNFRSFALGSLGRPRNAVYANRS